jgi:hypothetical protein
MEGQVLHLQKQIEEQAENAQDSGVEILKVRPAPWLTAQSLLQWIPIHPPG